MIFRNKIEIPSHKNMKSKSEKYLGSKFRTYAKSKLQKKKLKIKQRSHMPFSDDIILKYLVKPLTWFYEYSALVSLTIALNAF